jgi:hypothetical protein
VLTGSTLKSPNLNPDNPVGGFDFSDFFSLKIGD